MQGRNQWALICVGMGERLTPRIAGTGGAAGVFLWG